MIGDGMGTNQIYAGLTANKGFLNILRAKFVGFSKTYSADSYTTDSGAGGTAISSGYKTNNFAVGVDKTGVRKESIIEIAEINGLSTGIVVTSSVTHATPAAFYAHVISRNSEEAIAKYFLGSGIDILIGGGSKFFEKRADNINLLDSLRDQGYLVSKKFKDIDTSSTKNLICLPNEINIPASHKGRGDFLPQATNIAINKLGKNEKGFLLMVEGSQIDWACHNNDIEYLTSEVIDFDKAVGVAFDFADRNPGTLVIVTADHETGGLAIKDGDLIEGTLKVKFASKGHSGVMVPVFAYGTNASCIAGIYENTEIFNKMMCLLGFNE